MRISYVNIKNFRGLKSAKVYMSQHSVLIGDKITGKATILEAINLVLGSDRLNRNTPINEHDFYQGRYIEQLPENKESSDTEEEVAEPILEEVIEAQPATVADSGDEVETDEAIRMTFAPGEVEEKTDVVFRHLLVSEKGSNATIWQRN